MLDEWLQCYRVPGTRTNGEARGGRAVRDTYYLLWSLVFYTTWHPQRVPLESSRTIASTWQLHFLKLGFVQVHRVQTDKEVS